jgi:hypothetical protein
MNSNMDKHCWVIVKLDKVVQFLHFNENRLVTVKKNQNLRNQNPEKMSDKLEKTK